MVLDCWYGVMVEDQVMVTVLLAVIKMVLAAAAGDNDGSRVKE